MLQVAAVHPLGQFAVGSGTHFLHRHTGQNIHRHAAAPQHEVVLGQDIIQAMQIHGQDIHIQGLGQGERPLVEAADVTIRRACSFGKDHNTVAPTHQVLQMGKVLVVAVGHGTELRRVNDHAIVGIVPHPVVGQHDNLGRQLHQGHQIQVGLVVADDDGRTVECLPLPASFAETDTGHPADDEMSNALQQPMIEALPMPPPLQRTVYQ